MDMIDKCGLEGLDNNDDKDTAALMAVVDTCRNIGIFPCFSAHVHFILCYDVILDKAQLHMLHVQATVFV